MNTQKNPFLNRATHKKSAFQILLPKNPRISNPKESFDHPCCLKSGVPTLGLNALHWKAFRWATVLRSHPQYKDVDYMRLVGIQTSMSSNWFPHRSLKFVSDYMGPCSSKESSQLGLSYFRSYNFNWSDRNEQDWFESDWNNGKFFSFIHKQLGSSRTGLRVNHLRMVKWLWNYLKW